MNGLRSAIADRVTLVTSIPARQPYSSNKSTPKPYFVVKYAGDIKAASSLGGWDRFEIRPYVSPGSLLSLDQVVGSIVTALESIELTTVDGRTVVCEYVNTGSDFYDEEVEALTQVITFRFPKF